MRNKCLLFIAVAFCSLMALPLYAQVQISGVVTDAANGEPIIGASVLEEGTSNGTITDFDGNFAMTVANDAKVTFSYVGYKAQTLPAQAVMHVSLSEDSDLYDAVESVNADRTTDRRSLVTGTYDLLGRPISQPLTGMPYIHNGQLVLTR